MASDPFDPAHLIGHVKDAEYFEVPAFLSPATNGRIEIPQPFQTNTPLVTVKVGFTPIDERIEPLDLRVTKFMLLEVIVGIIMVVVFVRLAGLISTGKPPRGKFWNAFESLLIYIRDEVARPAIGRHDADRFLPFLWTMFFFILFCNLLGLVPFCGSATGSLATTGALALLTFLVVIGSGMAKMGIVGFWIGQVPHMDLPPALAVMLKPMIFAIEILGLCIKHAILAVRLLANMMAGHLVLAVVTSFIAAAAIGGASMLVWSSVTLSSVIGATMLMLLELLVAFIQAYIFTFLSALFIGMAVHPH